ncbi:MAG: hypothetical protein V4754_07485 [Pseudomonadota bacterium]
MSQLPALGSRQYQTPGLANGATQNESRATGNAATGTGALDRFAPFDAVSLSRSGLDLSAQGLSDRVDQLGNSTLDVAQNFLGSFARSLFGDAAAGATVAFDSASLETESRFAGLLAHSEGANGVSDGAAFSLSDSSHFIGKGSITTADGQRFDFEIEVRYESRIEAAAASDRATTAEAPEDDATDLSGLPKVDLPDIAFPGSLDDLFKLLGRTLQGELPAEPTGAGAADNGAKAGSLTLRMLNLLNSSKLIGDASDAASADTPALAKTVADAYGVTPPATTTPIALDPDSVERPPAA